eukprot:NODE_2524_length_1155_cov_52.050584_g2405_i0.p1 GENE.NODE_2524_length_1155_cov_52.050584_g2405_i0~~NODE_2524_length_1155_cov_52.050584_g2405_i0.p1  ORF type:complete len:223 (-),score=52.98 NODE_2524_length_1155_cov_52.050584_g2405_i0:221-889(-)
MQGEEQQEMFASFLDVVEQSIAGQGLLLPFCGPSVAVVWRASHTHSHTHASSAATTALAVQQRCLQHCVYGSLWHVGAVLHTFNGHAGVVGTSDTRSFLPTGATANLPTALLAFRRWLQHPIVCTSLVCTQLQPTFHCLPCFAITLDAHLEFLYQVLGPREQLDNWMYHNAVAEEQRAVFTRAAEGFACAGESVELTPVCHQIRLAHHLQASSSVVEMQWLI